MRFALFTAAVAALTTSPSAINILLNDDDGFSSANIREFYRPLKKAGHQVLMIAPVDNESVQAGRSSYSTLPTLVPAGALAFGNRPAR